MIILSVQDSETTFYVEALGLRTKVEKKVFYIDPEFKFECDLNRFIIVLEFLAISNRETPIYSESSVYSYLCNKGVAMVIEDNKYCKGDSFDAFITEFSASVEAIKKIAGLLITKE